MQDNTSEGKQKSVKGRAVTAGWICFTIGMVLMFVSLGTFFLYIPLFLAAFILSIVGMAQGRVAGGIVLLIVTVAIPGVIWLGLAAVKVSETFVEQSEAKRQALVDIEFEDLKGYIDGNYMYCEGKVRNNGESVVEYVKVGIEWLDKDGKILDTDWTYAIAGEGLRPGGAKSFEIMTRVDKRMAKYRCFVIED